MKALLAKDALLVWDSLLASVALLAILIDELEHLVPHGFPRFVVEFPQSGLQSHRGDYFPLPLLPFWRSPHLFPILLIRKTSIYMLIDLVAKFNTKMFKDLS